MRTKQVALAALVVIAILCSLCAWWLLPVLDEGPVITRADASQPVATSQPGTPIDMVAEPGQSADDHPGRNTLIEKTEPPAEEVVAEEGVAEASSDSADRLQRLQARLQELRDALNRRHPQTETPDDESSDVALDDLLRRFPELRLRKGLPQSEPSSIVISGRVTDESGHGIESARIHAWPTAVKTDGDGKVDREILQFTMPSEDVVPALDEVRPGTSDYHLMAQGRIVAVTDQSGYFQAELALSIPGGFKSIEIRVSPSKPGCAQRSIAQLEEVMPGAQLADIPLVLGRAAVLAGRVVDEEGRPVANALVAIQRPNNAEPDDGPLPGRSIYHDMRTTDEGEYRFDALAPGTWRVRAYAHERTSTADLQTVALVAEREDRLPDFVMKPATTLRVRVLLDREFSQQASNRPSVTFHIHDATGEVSTRKFQIGAGGVATYPRLPLNAQLVSISVEGYIESAAFPLPLVDGREIDLGEIRLISKPSD